MITVKYDRGDAYFLYETDSIKLVKAESETFKTVYLLDTGDTMFEIVCRYCENEFVIEADEDKKEIECPEYKNIIELDWSGDLCEDDECSGHCHGCSGCGDSDEDDM